MKSINIFLFCFTVSLSLNLNSQNIGIDVPSPSEKLEVGGVIYTNQGGIKFPDETVQTTAAYNTSQYQNAFERKQPFMLISDITDTFEVVEVVEGGANMVGNQMTAKAYKVKLNTENASVDLWQKLLSVLPTSKATIYFRQSNSPLTYKTIEMRNVIVSGINTSTVYIGDTNYAHLLEVTFSFAALEIRTFSPNDCFCWSFQTNSTCNCD